MPETIGQQLAAARQRRGLEVEDIAHKTRIHHDVVRQLEADDYSHFANLMFAKSFLQLYSDYIEVDASAAIDELAEVSLQKDDEQYLLGGIKPDVRSQFGHLNIRIPMRPVLATVAGIAVLGVSGFYLASGLYGENPQATEEPSIAIGGEQEGDAEVVNEGTDPEPAENTKSKEGDPSKIVNSTVKKETPRAVPASPKNSVETTPDGDAPETSSAVVPRATLPPKAIAVDENGLPKTRESGGEPDSAPLAVARNPADPGSDPILDVD